MQNLYKILLNSLLKTKLNLQFLLNPVDKEYFTILLVSSS